MSGPGWSLVLGASGGLGSACARSLAKAGYGLFGVHLDTAERMAEVEALKADVEQAGVPCELFNINASNPNAMKEAVGEMAERARDDGGVRVFVHAMAFGSLLPFIRQQPEDEVVTKRAMEMTMSIMAHSLVYWVQELVDRGLLREGAKVFALTSIGSSHVLEGYGAVSAAKCALESHVRQLACELAPRKIAVNAIRAGITQTPAMMKIPGSEQLVERVEKYNPYKRLTTPSDVAEAIVTLSSAPSSWMTGNVIGVDGGEKLTL